PLGWSVLYIAGPVLLVGGIAAAAVNLWTAEMLAGLTDTAATANEDPLLMFGGLATFWGLAGLSWIVSMLGFVAVLSVGHGYVSLYAQDVRAGMPRTYEPREVFTEAKRVVGSVVSTTLWIGLLMAGSVVLTLVPCAGIFAWLVGVLYISGILAPVYMMRVEERIGFWEAFSRCRKLASDRVGTTILLAFLVFLVYFVLATGLGLPQQIVSYLVMFNVAESSLLTRGLTVVFSMVSYAGQVVILVPAFAFALHYYSLVEATEAPWLGQRITEWRQRIQP
ncbi:MAG: hypothetical protein AAF752_10930, partial [Bacteroidota bacterium]